MSSDGQVYLKIGDVARLVGISPSAIRGWENLGLTRPRCAPRSAIVSTRDEDVRLLKKARYLRKVRGMNAARNRQMLKREGDIDRRPAMRPPPRPRLRSLRTQRGRSLAQVAAAAGISVGFLSALERSQMSASVGTLRRLARYYRTNILDFFDATELNSRLVRPPNARCWKRVPACAWNYSRGATQSWSRTCSASKPRAGSGESYAHEGEEFLFVLRGELKIALAGEEYHLKRGDSFYFESSTPHRWKNPGRAKPGSCG